MRRVVLVLLLALSAPAVAGASRFEGVLAEGGEAAHEVVVPPEAARVEALLSWTDDDGPGLSGADRFLLALRDPQGRVAVERESEAGVLVAVLRSPAPGTWTVLVRLEDTADPAGALVDAGESYDLLVTTPERPPSPAREIVLSEGGNPWAVVVGSLGAAAAALAVVIARRGGRDGTRTRRPPPP